jgi:hypothetical protein
MNNNYQNRCDGGSKICILLIKDINNLFLSSTKADLDILKQIDKRTLLFLATWLKPTQRRANISALHGRHFAGT